MSLTHEKQIVENVLLNRHRTLTAQRDKRTDAILTHNAPLDALIYRPRMDAEQDQALDCLIKLESTRHELKMEQFRKMNYAEIAKEQRLHLNIIAAEFDPQLAAIAKEAAEVRARFAAAEKAMSERSALMIVERKE